MHVVDAAVSAPGDQAGSAEGGAAPPEADGDSGVQATHEGERQEVEEHEIHRVQEVLVVLLDVSDTDDVDVAVVETIADGLDVEEPGRGVYRRQYPHHAYHHPEAPPGQHRPAFDGINDGQVALHAHDHEDQYAGGVGERVHVHVHFAEEIAQLPAVHQVIRERLVDAEYAHAEVGHRQIRQEEVRDAAQPSGKRHHEDHHQVTWNTRKQRSARVLHGNKIAHRSIFLLGQINVVNPLWLAINVRSD